MIVFIQILVESLKKIVAVDFYVTLSMSHGKASLFVVLIADWILNLISIDNLTVISLTMKFNLEWLLMINSCIIASYSNFNIIKIFHHSIENWRWIDHHWTIFIKHLVAWFLIMIISMLNQNVAMLALSS
jgi:hypothetical protein